MILNKNSNRFNEGKEGSDSNFSVDLRGTNVIFIFIGIEMRKLSSGNDDKGNTAYYLNYIEFLKGFMDNTESKSIVQDEEAHERSLILSENENEDEESKFINNPKTSRSKHK